MNNIGKLAELKATQYLINHKYKIIDCNFISRFGEIDIIASKGKYIAFIEVKMRDFDSIAQPREFVDSQKQSKIVATAKFFLMKNKTPLQPRFDVIEVICDNNSIKSIKHLENAFILE